MACLGLVVISLTLGILGIKTTTLGILEAARNENACLNLREAAP